MTSNILFFYTLQDYLSILSGRSIRKSELFLNPLVVVILLITISYISP